MLPHQTKAQTSMEFLVIILALVLIAASATLCLYSTFDLNTSIYLTKNHVMSELSDHPYQTVIKTITYNHNKHNLNLYVYLASENCKNIENKINFTDIKADLEKKTSYETVNIDLFCN